MERQIGGPLTNFLKTKWSMSDVSLSPMRIAMAFIEHIGKSKKYIMGGNNEKKLKGKNKHIKSAKTSKQTAFGPS